MTKEEMLDKFRDYVKDKGLLSSSSRSLYIKHYLPELPFEEIDRILSNWSTCTGKKENSSQSDGKYYEYFDSTQPAQPLCNSNVAEECSIKNHYLRQYYNDYIQKNKGITVNGTNYNYLDLIAAFIADGDVLYALTITDIILHIAQKAKSRITKKLINASSDNAKDALANGISALKKFQYWLELDSSIVQNINPKTKLNYIRKTIPQFWIYKIDGAIALIKEIGFENFIQYAIDQCYFFEPAIVIKRMNTLVSYFTIPDPNNFKEPFDLYARNSIKSTKKKDVDSEDDEYEDEQEKNNDYSLDPVVDKTARDRRKDKEDAERKYMKLSKLRSDRKLDKYALFTKKKDNVINYPIIIDNDGNAVRTLIEHGTGYSVSSGKSSIFKNFRISHIWGQAYDPRYFTNLWNIVLVPAWANDLLEKNADKGSLESKLKSTIMKICKVLYFDKITLNNWTKLKLPIPSVINDGKDVVKPVNEVKGIEPKVTTPNKGAQENDVPYLINIIEGKGNKRLGDIVKYAVYI